MNKAGETQLYQVEPRDADYQVDVVFIHGLGGDWQTTWGDPKSASKSWPHWIAEDIPQARVWCAQYPAAAFGWVGRNLRTLAASTSLLDRMATNDLGDRPIVLVCHSLGGIVAKQLLRTGFDLTATARWEKIAEAVRGVVFLSTPHSGAGSAGFIADFTKGLGLIGSLFRVTDSLTELRSNSDLLEDLGDWYRSAAVKHKISTLVYAEGHPVKSVVMVVPRSSANPGIPRVKPIELAFDHWEICKPLDRTYQVYTGTIAFIRGLLKKTAPTPGRRRLVVSGPKLELILLKPGKAGCVLPKLIDIPTGLVPRVELETARMGIPSLDWVKRTLSKGQVSGETTNPPSALVEYARELAGWYESVMNEAAMRLSKEIESSRTIQLHFQLLNSGTVPAQKPEIELLVSPALRITNSRPSRYWNLSSSPAPTPPPDLSLPAPMTTERPFISFYSEPAHTSTRDILKLESYVPTDLNDGQVSLKFWRASLQQGKAIDLLPVYIVFGEHPAQDITIEYKLFSPNQPNIGAGRIEVKIVE